MTINIIHDIRLLDRYGLLIDELHRQEVYDYKIWNCIEDKGSVIRSINLSHKAIVRYAKEQWLKEIAIAEDDLQFTAPGAWEFFLKNKPEVYDLYLACSYLPLHSGLVCGFHLYFISEKFYDQFLSVPDNLHIDTAMEGLKGNYVFCYPFPALQRPSWSANNREKVDYNKVLNPEDIYR